MACPPGLRSHGRKCGEQGRARDGDPRATGPAPPAAAATVHTTCGPQEPIGPTGVPVTSQLTGTLPNLPTQHSGTDWARSGRNPNASSPPGMAPPTAHARRCPGAAVNRGVRGARGPR